MRLQQMNLGVLLLFLLLVLAGFPYKVEGYLYPLTDRPINPLVDLWTDRFLDPLRVLEQIPVELGKK